MAKDDSMPLYLVSATFGGAPIRKALAARITAPTIVHEDPGKPATAGWPAKVDVARYRVDVELIGRDPAALRALKGATAASLVLTTKGDAGASTTETLLKVYFHTLPEPYMVRSREDGGVVSAWGIRGTVQWVPGNTLAAVWVTA